VRAPTRALIVEDIETWAYTLSRAARRAGAAEVVVCENLEAVRDAVRKARFDIAILDIGLDPDDDLNADGIKALEVIREIDGTGTRCVLVTGWQGGDRLDLQSQAQLRFGVDWAYMKERYEGHSVIAKLTELLEQAPARRRYDTTPIENLCASADSWRIEGLLVSALSPQGGVQTLYRLVARLLDAAIPVIAMDRFVPLQKDPAGVWAGLYWSRALASAVAVELGPAAAWQEGDDSGVPAALTRLLPDGVVPDLIESIRERNIAGRIWELPGISRDKFAE
jgi:CheY-like chemotaxis protein